MKYSIKIVLNDVPTRIFTKIHRVGLFGEFIYRVLFS